MTAAAVPSVMAADADSRPSQHRLAVHFAGPNTPGAGNTVLTDGISFEGQYLGVESEMFENPVILRTYKMGLTQPQVKVKHDTRPGTYPVKIVDASGKTVLTARTTVHDTGWNADAWVDPDSARPGEQVAIYYRTPPEKTTPVLEAHSPALSGKALLRLQNGTRTAVGVGHVKEDVHPGRHPLRISGTASGHATAHLSVEDTRPGGRALTPWLIAGGGVVAAGAAVVLWWRRKQLRPTTTGTRAS
ncbi:hypothetical protein [Streptomyces chartreusis]|uniref:hypothetical protein n=1 Tax=Streptomyces chartreusis TaxID=1969 RepID=UPI002E175CA9